MATLNIKNFPDELHQRLRALAQSEQRSLSQQVIRLLGEAVSELEPRSILELRGLGADLWRHTDASKLLDEERGSWD